MLPPLKRYQRSNRNKFLHTISFYHELLKFRETMVMTLLSRKLCSLKLQYFAVFVKIAFYFDKTDRSFVLQTKDQTVLQLKALLSLNL